MFPMRSFSCCHLSLWEMSIGCRLFSDFTMWKKSIILCAVFQMKFFLIIQKMFFFRREIQCFYKAKAEWCCPSSVIQKSINTHSFQFEQWWESALLCSYVNHREVFQPQRNTSCKQRIEKLAHCVHSSRIRSVYK